MALTRSYLLSSSGGASAVAGSDTMAGVNLGTAGADRVCVYLVQPVNAGATTATINGVAATVTNQPGLGIDILLVSALVPLGTSGDLVVNGSGGFQLFGGWAIYGYANVAPNSFDVALNNNTTQSVIAGDCVIASGIDGANGTSPTFTAGVTDDTSAPVTTNAGSTYSRPASAIAASTNAAYTIGLSTVYSIIFSAVFGQGTPPSGRSLAATQSFTMGQVATATAPAPSKGKPIFSRATRIIRPRRFH